MSEPYYSQRAQCLRLSERFCSFVIVIYLQFTFDVLPVITGVPKFRNWSRDQGLCHIFNFSFVIVRSRLSGPADCVTDLSH